MTVHTHRFVEDYKGMVGIGFDRETDESTLVYYLQKFSDDALMGILRQRLTDQEITDLFDHLAGLLRQHLSESEYHDLFLKDHP